MSEEEIKDVVEILELAKEEIENNDENITATLDLQDLKSLKRLYELYIESEVKNKEYEDFYGTPPTFEDNKYIAKDKIRELLQRYDKDIAWANADDHYYFVKFIKELLEEEK